MVNEIERRTQKLLDMIHEDESRHGGLLSRHTLRAASELMHEINRKDKTEPGEPK